LAAGELRVLDVDDNPGDARLLEWALAHEPDGRFRFERADRVSAALERLAQGGVDAVLLDLGLPDSRGMEGLQRLRARCPEVAVIVLTGSEDPALVRHAIVSGAQDFQVKGIFPPGHLTNVIRAAVRRQRLEADLFRADPAGVERLLTATPDAVAVVPERGMPLASAAFLELTGTPRPEIARAVRSITERLAAGPASAGAVAPPTREGGAVSAVGVIAVDRPGGERAELECVVRRAPSGAPARRVLLLRERGTRTPPPPAEPPTPHPIDETVFAQLLELAGGDPTFVSTLLGAFLEETERLLPALQEAADQGNAASVVELAHRLKSGAAQVGAMELSRRLAELEREASARHLEESRSLARRVAREYPEVARALDTRRGSPGARSSAGAAR
jgi:DNA-binding NarL/FixJ family response regulator/HPt (histidine-containing phosphotransfer) domain-containing protein